MIYQYNCPNDGVFEISAPMKDGPPSTVYCPICKNLGSRIYNSTEEIWYTDGAHKCDYGSNGHKQDRFAKEYERQTGEKAPAPDPNVPRNYKREREKGL